MPNQSGRKYLDRDFDALWTKSDLDLTLQMSRVARALLTQNLGVTERSDNERKYAAAEAVKAEKNRREQEKEKIQTIYDQRVEKAFMKLKVAYTPNGQLVAAILEDETSLTEEELHNWCDELQAIADEEFHVLLSDLVDDGIIYQPDPDQGKYHLLRLCMKTRVFDYRYDYLSWLKIVLARKFPDKDMSRFFKINNYTLSNLPSRGGTFYPEDMFYNLEFVIREYSEEELERVGYNTVSIRYSIENNDLTLAYSGIRSCLDQLSKWDVLGTIQESYYLPLPGEHIQNNK